MIPKIIHLCWLSGDSYPENIKECIESWKKNLPDYKILLWDTKRFDVSSTIWTKEAFENKKYAFVADYIRLFALYKYGGIYLDSDVMVYKSFDELLHLPYFIGQDYERSFEAAVIGSNKGTKWIGKIIEYYKGRHFIKEDGSFDMKPLPSIFFECLNGKYTFIRLHKIIDYTYSAKEINVFDNNFFNSRNCYQVKQTKKSFCAHNYAGTWNVKKVNWKQKLKKTFPKWFLNAFFYFSHKTFNKKALGKFEPKISKEIW